MQNQTLKALSTLTNHTVQHLLMGGQACVLYGAAQFSRDADIAVLASPDNLDRLKAALNELQAEVIAVPPFEAQYLERGLAVHFRCRRLDFSNLRIDVMSVMRDVDPFPELWQRRTTIEYAEGACVDVLNIADLIRAKKTQRDKDWPMIRALVESHFSEYRDNPTAESIAFWLREGRTPALLINVASQHPNVAASIAQERQLINSAIAGSIAELQSALIEEQHHEQERDRIYWRPLIAELEQLRQNRQRRN